MMSHNVRIRVALRPSLLRCRGERGEAHARSACTHQRLLSTFLAFRQPIAAKTTYSIALRDFTHVAILGYECGLTEASFQQYLREEDRSALEGKECLELVCLIWITLLLSHQSRTRWSMSDPVSIETLKRCRGFVELMVISYFDKGMVWIPIERLQLEQRAIDGSSESTERVAEKARIVFTTLETVAPQFPSM